MKDLVHPSNPEATNGFSSKSRTAPAKTVLRVLLLIVSIVVISMIIILARNPSLSRRSQPTSLSNQIQTLFPTIDSSPTFSPVPTQTSNNINLIVTNQAPVKASGGKTAFFPIVTRLVFNEHARPYSPSSFWNTLIGNNPEYDPHSAEMIATIGLHNEGRISAYPNQYSFPVYYADINSPRWDIPCNVYRCTIVTLEKIFTVTELSDVPIPELANPAPGTDGQMIIIDKNTFTEYDLWQAQRTADGWSVSNGSVYNVLWSGTPQRYGSRGAGLPYLAGLIRPWEIAQGRIDHVLAFSYPEPALKRCVYPATKTDGKSNLPYAIPQGAHLQLDPLLTEADFNRMGLSNTGKIIARALQEYGMVLVDTGGRTGIYAEDLESNPYQVISWSDPELNLTKTTLDGLLYTSFRVLKLPEAYWNPGLGTATNGDCYVYSNQ